MTQADALLPLLTYPDATTEDAVDAAIATAARVGAQVTAAAFEVQVPPPASPTANLVFDFPAMAAEQTRYSHEKASALLSAAETSGRNRGVAVETTRTRTYPGGAGELAAEQARLHGFVIVPLRPGDGASVPLAEAVIFGSGRPVLVLPPGPPDSVARLDRAIVAWDGSRAAARAMADALPFLARCEAVSVIAVAGEKRLPDRSDPLAAAQALARWGVQARAERVDARGQTAGAALSALLRERGANLLVMGGYGHSRLRDFVLGGATRSILADPPVPALLSH